MYETEKRDYQINSDLLGLEPSQSLWKAGILTTSAIRPRRDLSFDIFEVPIPIIWDGSRAMKKMFSGQTCDADLERRTSEPEAMISSECSLRPELSGTLLTFSAHQHGHSRGALQWTPSFLVNPALRSIFNCCWPRSNVWVRSRDFERMPAMSSAFRITHHFLCRPIWAICKSITVHSFKNRNQLILKRRKHKNTWMSVGRWDLCSGGRKLVFLEAASKALPTNSCAARSDIIVTFWRYFHDFSEPVLSLTGTVNRAFWLFFDFWSSFMILRTHFLVGRALLHIKQEQNPKQNRLSWLPLSLSK